MNALLIEHLYMLTQAAEWLDQSYERCRRYTLNKALSDSELIDFEALTSRFSRVADILIQKVYRSIDYVELETSGTLIDSVNRAHKRGLLDEVSLIRKIKDLRNDIAHEYATDDLLKLFELTLSYCPILLDYVKRAQTYISQMK